MHHLSLIEWTFTSEKEPSKDRNSSLKIITKKITVTLISGSQTVH